MITSRELAMYETYANTLVKPSLLQIAGMGVVVDFGRQVGEGGYGSVYRAFSPELNENQPLAVKMMPLPVYPKGDSALHGPAELLNGPDAAKGFAEDVQRATEMRERIMREFKMMQMLCGHPGVAKVLLAGVVRGQKDEWHVGVMEFYERGSLRKMMAQGLLNSPIQSVHLVGDVASAAQHAHDFGIVHKDVKPENVLISASGRGILSDFGIAQPIDRRFWIKEDEAFCNIGTVAYKAPEHGLGKPNAQSDQYSLAAMTYEMLTGFLPRGEDGSEPLLSFEQRTGSKNTEMLAAMEPVVLKALSSDERKRYLSITAYAHDLEEKAFEAVSPRSVARLAFPDVWGRRKSRELTLTAQHAANEGRYEDALNLYDYAIGHDQINSEAHFQKAHVLELLEQPQAAKAAFIAAYKCPIKTPADLVRRGVVLARFGHHEEALGYYAEARDNEHYNMVACTYEAESMQACAEIELLRGNDDRANSLYNQACEMYDFVERSQEGQESVRAKASSSKRKLLGRIAAVHRVAVA